MNILLSAIGKDVSLMEEFRKALKKTGGGRIIATDNGRYAPAAILADAFYQVPSFEHSSFISSLLRVCKKENVKLLIPTHNEELPIIAKNRERFEKAGVTVTISDPKVVALCRDKDVFQKFCNKHGFDTPRTYGIKEARQKPVFPLFLKEREGRGGTSGMRVENKKELEAALVFLKKPFIQECVDATEYTVDVFTDFEGKVLSVVPRERMAIWGGEMFTGRTVKNKKIIQETLRLAEALGVRGHANIQCFVKGKTVAFIECNPRFGGGSALSFAAGASSPLFLLQLMKGKRLSPQIGKFKDRKIVLRYPTGLYAQEKDLKGRRV